MNPLELDDYHEKAIAELSGQIGFDPEPVSNCSQLLVIWGGKYPHVGLFLALPNSYLLFEYWGLW